MNISVNSKKDTFHLYNNEISYIMTVLPNRQMGQLYFGARIHEREDYSYLLEMRSRPMTACISDTKHTEYSLTYESCRCQARQ